MNKQTSLYKRHRYPPDIIQFAVWLYYRFNLSHRDIEDLLAERGVKVDHATIHRWVLEYAPQLEVPVSPIALLKLEGKKRQRASRKPSIEMSKGEDNEW